jgi:peptide/nickel transport system permease protein
MRTYLLRRLGASLIVLLLSSMLVFAGIRALPGDPALALAGESRTPQALHAIRVKYGLDHSIPVQYVSWLGHVVRGDLGTSSQTGLSVASTIVARLPVTLELAFLALLVAIGIGMSAGVLAAVRRGSAADHVSGTAALAGLSVPHFWLGLMMILLFSIALGVFPASGFVPFAADPLDNLRHMVMPALVLGTGLAAVIFRQTRSAMLESLSADYVRTARAKGLSERSVVGSHALRNGVLTVVTIIGLQLGLLISGAVVTEQVFVLPGFGKLTLDAILQRDYPVIEGVVLITTVGYIVVNLIVDLLYTVLNPRIRITGATE